MFSRGDVGHRFDKFTLALWMICAPKGPQMRFERKFLRGEGRKENIEEGEARVENSLSVPNENFSTDREKSFDPFLSSE